MNDQMNTRMIGHETAAEAWTALQEFFTAQTSSKISQFKTQLQNTKKNSLSISEYLLKIKSTVDMLKAVGHDFSVSDHVEAIFNGLGPDYDIFYTSFNIRKEQVTIAELEALLMSQEARIDKSVKELDISNVEANLAHHSSNRYLGSSRGGYPNQRGRLHNHIPPSSSSNNRDDGTGFSNFRGSN